jgi:anti-sigma B factor antagonist
MKGIDVIVEQAGSRYQVAVVRVLGQIDTTTSHELERRLQYLLKDQQFEIAIDLSKVSYISSAGWGIFISEIRGIRESGGDLKLAGMTPEVAEVFELLEFHNILESYRTVEGAVEKFDRNRMHQGAHAQTDGRRGVDVTGATDGRVGGVDGAGMGEAVGTGHGSGAGGDSGAELALQAEYASGGGTNAGPGVKAAPSIWAVGTTLLSEAPETAGSITRPAAKVPRTEARESATARPENKSLDSLVYEIVKEDPEQGCLKIRKELSKRGYRQPMNPLAVFAQLKRLNLESKEKRKRFAESGRTDKSGE